ncbi:MAG: DMT family transporter [Chloroflexi bacterium]|nr:DMT family transporter [Chloroflexota bacterium]
MTPPVLLSILGALTFALGSIFTRRAVVRVADPAVGALISVPLAIPFFVLILALMGDLGDITGFSWQAFAWLTAAGIAHFVVGRSFQYNLVKMVGANLASVINRFSSLFSVILGVTVLDEPFSWRLALGVFLILVGLVATTINPQNSDLNISAITGKVWLMGFLVGIAWGISPILIKIGLGDSGSPIAGALVSYAGATVVMSGSLLSENKRTNISSTKGLALLFFCLAGLLSATAQLLRYVALSTGAASVVQPVFSLNPLFLLLLSFFFNRKLEAFGPMVIIGIFAAVGGTILLA